MPKKGVSAISGNISPIVGEKNTYHISDWYPDTPSSERDLKAVTWELFRKRSNGKFTTTHVRKKGDSSFTFGEASLGHTYRLEGYLHEPEGGGLIITPKPNKIPQICKTELYYTDDTKGSTFSFMEKLRAKAYCVNMFHKEVVFTLWEDDAKGAGHHVNNTAIETQKARVDENGLVSVEFILTKALMQKAMKGEANTKELEFYVTVEYYKHNKHATENVEVENPYAQYYNPKPYQPPVIPKAKGSPAAQKPASQKEEKGIIDTAIDKMKELWDWGESKGTATKEKSPTILKPEGRSAVVVGEVKREEEKEESCVCKQYDLVWGNKVSCNERKKVIEVAKNLDVNPNWLMTVIAIETIESFNPAIQNSYGYTGLIQIGKDAADTIGTTIDSLKKMTFVEQMDYVQKHLMPKKDKYKTLTDLYLAVLYPNACGHGSERDYVVLYGTAYRNNPLFFKEEGEWEYKIIDKDGKKIKKVVPTDSNGHTYVWEVAMVAQEKFTKGLGIKENFFSCNEEKNNTTNSPEADIEYHIFSKGGDIHYKIRNKKRQTSEYFYYDLNGKIHNLGKYKLNKICDNYGGTYKDRIGGDNIYLIDIRKIKNYSKGDIKFKLSINTNRYYINDVALGALFGAMLDCSYTDFTFNRFSNEKGQSIGGSKSHKNGMHGDLRYLRKDKSGKGVHLDLSFEIGDPCGWKGMDETRQNKFNDALYKYGWKSMLSWQYNSKTLHHSKHFENHNHHLHVQSFKPNLKEIPENE